MPVIIKILLLIALILRLSFVLTGTSLGYEIWSDMQGYVNIAEEITEGEWRPFHFFQSIGYPLVIFVFKKMFQNWDVLLSVFQVLFSFLSTWLMYELARKSFGEKIALFSLAIGALHFPWIAFPGYALPEMIFTFFILLTGYFSYQILTNERRIILFSFMWGVSFVLALWLKGTHVFWGPIFLLSLIFYKRKNALIPCLIISSVVAVGIICHGILTYQTIGKVQLSASAGGLNFVEGKCPSKENIDTTGYSWQSPLFYQLRQDQSKTWDRPFTDSRYFFKEGLKCIVHEPFALIQSLEGIPFLFFGNTTWPLNQKDYAQKIRLYEIFFAIFMVVGVALNCRRWVVRGIKDEEFLVWVTPILALFLCVYIFKSEIRFRVPFDGWLIPLALRGWAEMRRRTPESMLDLDNEKRQ